MKNKYEPGAAPPPWRVGEFRSSAVPGKVVLMLAVGGEIGEYQQHPDFVRWVSPVTITPGHARASTAGHQTSDAGSFSTFSKEEREALELHGLQAQRPSVVAEAFVLGLRHAHKLQQACPACKGSHTVDLLGDGIQRPCTACSDGTAKGQAR